MNKITSSILNDDWYKTATPEEMKIALMHVQQGALDRLFNDLNKQKNETRQEIFEECSVSCKWKD